MLDLPCVYWVFAIWACWVTLRLIHFGSVSNRIGKLAHDMSDALEHVKKLTAKILEFSEGVDSKEQEDDK